LAYLLRYKVLVQSFRNTVCTNQLTFNDDNDDDDDPNYNGYVIRDNDFKIQFTHTGRGLLTRDHTLSNFITICTST